MSDDFKNAADVPLSPGMAFLDKLSGGLVQAWFNTVTPQPELARVPVHRDKPRL